MRPLISIVTWGVVVTTVFNLNAQERDSSETELNPPEPKSVLRQEERSPSDQAKPTLRLPTRTGNEKPDSSHFQVFPVQPPKGTPGTQPRVRTYVPPQPCRVPTVVYHVPTRRFVYRVPQPIIVNQCPPNYVYRQNIWVNRRPHCPQVIVPMRVSGPHRVRMFRR